MFETVALATARGKDAPLRRQVHMPLLPKGRRWEDPIRSWLADSLPIHLAPRLVPLATVGHLPEAPRD